MKPATAEQNQAYRAGLCIDCKGKPSAGRPRCDACHLILLSQRGERTGANPA